MKIVIIGAGGFGREVLAVIKNINQVKPSFEILGFLDDGMAVGTEIHDYHVIGAVSTFAATGAEGAVIAIGKPAIREAIVEKLPITTLFPNIIHPLAMFIDPQRTRIGHGNIICAGNIFTTDISLGNFCIVNLSCTIGHDAILGDFSSIMPGVNISGGAKLARGVYVGTGAKLIKATKLGSYCTVGAGAVVDADILPHQTVVGVPAKPLNKKG